VGYISRDGQAIRAARANKQQHGALIAAIAAAAQGDAQARAAVEAALPQLEANGWGITDATRRIWAGEREWGALVEELSGQEALFVLRVPEEIGG
jgi:hypothetical protein